MMVKNDFFIIIYMGFTKINLKFKNIFFNRTEHIFYFHK